TRFQTLRPGNASLVGALPERTPITLLYKDFDILSANQPPAPPQPSPRPTVPPEPNPRTDVALGDQDLILQTLPIDTTNIPQQGILFIEGDNAYAADGFRPDTPGEQTVMNPEFVAYSSHRLVNGFLQFSLSARGLFGTTQRKHAIFSAVVLVSVNFSNDLSDYGLQALTATGDQTAANQLGSTQGTLAALTADENNYEWIKLFRSDEAAFRNYGIIAGLMRNRGEATFLGPKNRIFTGAFRPQLRRLYLNPFKSNPGRKTTVATAILQDENWSFLTPLVDGYAGIGVGAGDGKLTGAELNALPGMVWDANGQRVAATMNIAQWLGRIEPAERGRAQEETGIGNSQGPGRGPGIAHVNGTELLPVVIMERNGRTIRNGNLFVDRFDVVTVTDNADPPIREEHMVVHARPIQRGDRIRVSLDAFVSRTITGLSGGRFAKFPTGRMPRHGRPMSIGAPTPKIAASQPVTGGGNNGGNSGGNNGGNSGGNNGGNGAPPNPYGPIGGYIDEIKMTFDQTRVSTLRELLPVGTQTLQQRPVNPFPRASRRGNSQPFLAKVGNEIIAFTDPDNLTMTRGMLKSTAEAHGTDEPVWILPFPDIAVAAGGFSQPFNNSLSVQRNSHRGFLPKNSYFAIDAGTGQGFQTIIAYAQRRGGSFNFSVDRNGNGVFRNCFGSAARQPASGDVLVNLPVRFHDHYQVNKTSLDGTYYQFSKTIPGAFIESIDWEVEHPNAYTQIVVRVRIDGKDSWEGRDTAKNGKNGVLVFHDPPLRRTARGQTERTNWIKRNGDQIDVQVWMTFKNGAFARDCWKQTPSLKNIKVKYWQQTRVRYHEEKQE
ncbi:MAG: hypothetical protein P1V97_07070, partial [Planctomycetota bacterium]|nr:hypothetical protein [Planctomycetota bacterium]